MDFGVKFGLVNPRFWHLCGTLFSQMQRGTLHVQRCTFFYRFWGQIWCQFGPRLAALGTILVHFGSRLEPFWVILVHLGATRRVISIFVMFYHPSASRLLNMLFSIMKSQRPSLQRTIVYSNARLNPNKVRGSKFGSAESRSVNNSGRFGMLSTRSCFWQCQKTF